MGNRCPETMTTTMQIVNDYVTEFINKMVEEKVKPKKILADWKSKETQAKLKKVLAESIKDSQPKRTKALSAYNVFMKQEYTKVKEDNQGLDSGELMKLMSSKWKGMNDKKKSKYNEAAAKLKEQMPAKKGSRKKPGQPKGASNAYIHFGLAMRPTIKSKHSDWDFKKINNEVSIQWKGMSDKKKEKYIKLAEADKKRYEKEMEKWKAEQTSDSEESGAESGEGSGDESGEGSGDESGDESGEGSDEE